MLGVVSKGLNDTLIRSKAEVMWYRGPVDKSKICLLCHRSEGR